jgi:hypothetical protein
MVIFWNRVGWLGNWLLVTAIDHGAFEGDNGDLSEEIGQSMLEQQAYDAGYEAGSEAMESYNRNN